MYQLMIDKFELYTCIAPLQLRTDFITNTDPQKQQYKQYPTTPPHSTPTMGNKLKQSSLFTKTAMSHIGTVSICPNCDQQFPANTTYQNFDQHVTQCLQNFRPTDQERLRMQRRKRSKDSIGSKNSQEDDGDQHDYVTIEVYIKRYDSVEGIKPVLSNPQKIGKNKLKTLPKVHKNQLNPLPNPIQHPSLECPSSSRTYKWTKSQLTYSQSLLSSLTHTQILKQATAYKILWFHHKLSNNRVTWKSGAQQITFHPEHIVRDSLNLRKINLFKELKITVVNDVVHDAGGLLREWANMLVRELVGRFELFVRNKLGYYVLNPELATVQKLNSPVQWQKQSKPSQKQKQAKPQSTNNSKQPLPYPQMKQPTQSQHTPNFPVSSNNNFNPTELQQLQIYKNYYYNNMYNNSEDEDEFDQYEQYFNQQQLQQQQQQQQQQQLQMGKQNDNYNSNNCTMNQIGFKYAHLETVTYRDLYQLFGCLLAKVFIQKVNIQINFDWIFLTQLTTYTKLNHDSLPKLPASTILPLISTYDPQLYTSMTYLQNLQTVLEQTPKQSPVYSEKYQQLQSLCLTFSIPPTLFHPQHNLITNGSTIQVKDLDQLKTYIKLVTNYYYHDLHQSQHKIIFYRFSSIIKPQIFSNLFMCEQLQLLLNGVDGNDINVKDWQAGTQYKQPYHDKHKVIGYFWSTVQKMSGEQKMRLLKFVTGASRLPIYGFKNLETNRGETSHFVIQSIKYDKKTSAFPQAHTCFNRLVLPTYPNQSTLAESLHAVIHSSFDGVWGKQ